MAGGGSYVAFARQHAGAPSRSCASNAPTGRDLSAGPRHLNTRAIYRSGRCRLGLRSVEKAVSPTASALLSPTGSLLAPSVRWRSLLRGVLSSLPLDFILRGVLSFRAAARFNTLRAAGSSPTGPCRNPRRRFGAPAPMLRRRGAPAPSPPARSLRSRPRLGGRGQGT